MNSSQCSQQDCRSSFKGSRSAAQGCAHSPPSCPPIGPFKPHLLLLLLLRNILVFSYLLHTNYTRIQWLMVYDPQTGHPATSSHDSFSVFRRISQHIAISSSRCRHPKRNLWSGKSITQPIGVYVRPTDEP